MPSLAVPADKAGWREDSTAKGWAFELVKDKGNFDLITINPNGERSSALAGGAKITATLDEKPSRILISKMVRTREVHQYIFDSPITVYTTTRFGGLFARMSLMTAKCTKEME